MRPECHSVVIRKHNHLPFVQADTGQAVKNGNIASFYPFVEMLNIFCVHSDIARPADSAASMWLIEFVVVADNYIAEDEITWVSAAENMRGFDVIRGVNVGETAFLIHDHGLPVEKVDSLNVVVAVVFNSRLKFLKREILSVLRGDFDDLARGLDDLCHSFIGFMVDN